MKKSYKELEFEIIQLNQKIKELEIELEPIRKSREDLKIKQRSRFKIGLCMLYIFQIRGSSTLFEVNSILSFIEMFYFRTSSNSLIGVDLIKYQSGLAPEDSGLMLNFLEEQKAILKIKDKDKPLNHIEYVCNKDIDFNEKRFMELADFSQDQVDFMKNTVKKLINVPRWKLASYIHESLVWSLNDFYKPVTIERVLEDEILFHNFKQLNLIN